MWSKSKSTKAQRSSGSKSSKSSRHTDQTPNASAKTISPKTGQLVKYQGPQSFPDLSPVLKGMDRKNLLRNPSSTAIVVVGQDEVKELRKLLEDKKYLKNEKMTIETNLIVTAPKKLQGKLDQITKAGHKVPELHLFVSSAIQCITYHISGLVKNVSVWHCSEKGPLKGLRIGSDSTYCDFRTYAWDNRPQELRANRRTITHHEGCHWDLGDCRDEANALLQPSYVSMPSLEKQDLAKALGQFAEVRGKHMQDGTSGSGSLPNPNDDTPGWLTHWKAILRTAVSAIAAAGCAGTYGFFWYSSSGLLIKGPFGLSLALGHTTSVLTGGSIMAAVGAGAAASSAVLVASTLVYYIPKDTVFDFLKQAFSKIWDAICDVAAWLWEKVKDLPSLFYALFE